MCACVCVSSMMLGYLEQNIKTNSTIVALPCVQHAAYSEIHYLIGPKKESVMSLYLGTRLGTDRITDRSTDLYTNITENKTRRDRAPVHNISSVTCTLQA